MMYKPSLADVTLELFVVVRSMHHPMVEREQMLFAKGLGTHLTSIGAVFVGRVLAVAMLGQSAFALKLTGA